MTQEMIGDLRERMRAVETGHYHLSERVQANAGRVMSAQDTIGRLATRMYEAERHMSELIAASIETKRAIKWIDDQERRAKDLEVTKLKAKEVRDQAIRVLQLAAIVVTVIAYAVGLIDGEKFKALSSALGLGR